VKIKIITLQFTPLPDDVVIELIRV
jgi:hypothetical protein